MLASCLTNLLYIYRCTVFHQELLTFQLLREKICTASPFEWIIKTSLENTQNNFNKRITSTQDGAVVRVLASHRCGSGLILRLNTICGLSLLLVLFSALRGFSPVFPSPQKQTLPNSNSIQISVEEQPLCGDATANSHYLLLG